MSEFEIDDLVRLRYTDETGYVVSTYTDSEGGQYYWVDLGTADNPYIEEHSAWDLEKVEEKEPGPGNLATEEDLDHLQDLVKKKHGDFQLGDTVLYEGREYEIVGYNPGLLTCWKIQREGETLNTVPGELTLVRREEPDTEAPNHYTYLKELIGVEPWDILDCVAGDDPHMWNLGKYWFRLGRKDGESTLKDKKKMLTYLQRSIEKEEGAN